MSTQKNQPTVEELNAIQAEWMKLDSHAPAAEKRRVFALMERYPRVYVSGHDGLGICMCDGQPLSMPVEFESALATCRAHDGRTDVAWNGKKGEWYSIMNTNEQHNRLPIGTKIKAGDDVYRPGLFLPDGTTAKFSAGTVAEHLKNGGVSVKFTGYRNKVDYTEREAAKFTVEK